MGRIGTTELLVILMIALVLFGGSRWQVWAKRWAQACGNSGQR